MNIDALTLPDLIGRRDRATRKAASSRRAWRLHAFRMRAITGRRIYWMKVKQRWQMRSLVLSGEIYSRTNPSIEEPDSEKAHLVAEILVYREAAE